MTGVGANGMSKRDPRAESGTRRETAASWFLALCTTAQIVYTAF